MAAIRAVVSTERGAMSHAAAAVVFDREEGDVSFRPDAAVVSTERGRGPMPPRCCRCVDGEGARFHAAPLLPLCSSERGRGPMPPCCSRCVNREGARSHAAL